MYRTKIRGNHIQYEDLNQQHNEAILLVHGHPFNHSMWDYQHEALDNYRLIIPDLLGYGASDFDFDKIYIETQALDLALLLDSLQIDKAHLMGLSMGGQIIVEFHRLFPNRVKSLAICASTPYAETPESYQKRLRLAEDMAQIGMLEYTKRDIHQYMNLEATPTTSDTYKHLFKMMSETKVNGAVASHRGRAERRDNFNHLRQVSVPTLVVGGENDFFFNLDDMRKVANQIDGAQFEVIARSGHLPNMENPAVFNGLIKNFYASI